MRITRLILIGTVLAVLSGCAHDIAISPDISRIERDAGSSQIKKSVAYYIPEEARSKSVTSPGGGGDKVTYRPYHDIEAGFYKMLSNVFENVTVLKSPDDADAIAKNNVSYVIRPEITTSTGSSGILTWMPTEFSVDMTCSIDDAAGKPVASKTVNGQGHAEFEQLKSDFALAGKLAAQDALLKMQKALLEIPELQN